MDIKKVGVVGCGLMGSGIAQVCAQSGYETVVREISPELLQKGLGKIEKQLAGAVQKGRLSEETRSATLSRLRGTTELSDLAGCDLVIEAIIENPEEKKALFSELDRICPPSTIFASNTSSIPIIQLAAATNRPDRFIGLHFFNPVPVMQLVEIVKSISSSDEVVEIARRFSASLGKQAIVAKDRAGFVVNLLLVPYLLDAVRALEIGVASKEDIDTGMKLGCNHPMGPLALLDFVGLDTTYYIAEIMYNEFKDPRYAPPTLLKQMVIAGHHGRKTGKGFYDYPQS